MFTPRYGAESTPGILHRSAVVIALGAAAAVITPAHANDTYKESGFTELQNRTLPNTPTGAGVVVGQVEVNEIDGVASYYPDPNSPLFPNKTFNLMSGSNTPSGHATTVGQYFYSPSGGMAYEIDTIYVWEALNFVQSGYLRFGGGTGSPPLTPPGGMKILNNSWVAQFGSAAQNNEALRRADFAADRDDVLFINGVNNPGTNTPLLGHMFNGISVGRMDGLHQHDPTLSTLDGPGRLKPDMVAPGSFTSFSTPVVSSAAALLVETAATDPNLSGNANAGRSEVLKVVLLGGARHRPGWTNNPLTSGPNRGQATQPIDTVYGVDVLNINNSHLIFTAGEQDASLTIPATVNAQTRGWDLASINPSSSVYYRFDVEDTADEVMITATWHRQVAAAFNSYTLANVNLLLMRVHPQTGVASSLIGDAVNFTSGNVGSFSAVDNVEHLYIRGLTPGEYVLQVTRADSLAGARDVAVSWMFPDVTVLAGDANRDHTVGIADLLAVIGKWGVCIGCTEDLTNDGSAGIADLLEVIGTWGASN